MPFALSNFKNVYLICIFVWYSPNYGKHEKVKETAILHILINCIWYICGFVNYVTTCRYHILLCKWPGTQSTFYNNIIYSYCPFMWGRSDWFQWCSFYWFVNLPFLMFGTWTNGSTLILTISTKFNSNVLVIKNTRVNSLVDIRVITAIHHKLIILVYETI